MHICNLHFIDQASLEKNQSNSSCVRTKSFRIISQLLERGRIIKTRAKFVIGGTVILAAITALSVQGLQEMSVFFYTPVEVLANPSMFENKTIRIGALVQRGSVEWDAQDIRLSFNITEDGKKNIPVFYDGVKPDLFREGQGVVVEGKMKGQRFEAVQLLVKHSENYTVETEHKKTKEDYYKSIQAQ